MAGHVETRNVPVLTGNTRELPPEKRENIRQVNGLSFSSYSTNAEWMSGALTKTAAGKLVLGSVAGLAGGGVLAAWLLTAGILLLPLAGSIKASGEWARRRGEGGNYPARIKKTVGVFRRSRCVRSRAYRSASRPTFAHAAGDGASGDDGDSDSGPSGDPPRFSLSVTTPFPGFFNFKFMLVFSPWLHHGCWRMTCCKYAVRGCPA